MNFAKYFVALSAVAGVFGQNATADTFSFTNNLAIPDGQYTGVSDTETISSSHSQITSVWVSLNITGDFNGDLYCYLQHDGELSVLLNREGRSLTNSFGYADCGFNITLSDLATNGNIHTYQNVLTPPDGSQLTGMWQPDGRTNSPLTVLDINPSTAGLNVFNNLDPSGSWTLFVADLSPGGTSQLVGWQLIVDPVPEPSTTALTALGAGLILWFRWRIRFARATE